MGNDEKQDSVKLPSTGHSNSRLSSQSLGITENISVSFDRITVVGFWIPSREKFVKRHVENDARINLRDTGYDRFKCHALDNKVYVEYNRRQAEAMQRSEVRVEFNPNELTDEDKNFIQSVFLNNMRVKDFSRIDLAFDLPMDLTDFYVMSDKGVKKTIFYGRDGMPETKYFGVRDSERYIRIYNKKRQLQDVKSEEIKELHLWRVEFELKRYMTNQWYKCFDDLHVIQPGWTSIEKDSTRAMIYMLMNEEGEWGKLTKNTKTKYRKLIKELSDIDLSDSLRVVLKRKYKLLRDELADYVEISPHDKLYDFDL